MSSPILSGRRLLAIGGIAMLAIAALVAVMAMSASAASNTIGVKMAKVGSKREPIGVNSKGVAVYWLSGDTKTHMECRKSNGCFSFWPPVTVKGHVTKAAGVKGKLGTFKRNGFTQVTLAGHPLYTYSGDGKRPGVVTGDGIVTFGGTWHVVTAGKASGGMAPAPPSNPPPGYGRGW
jgi:predicted lipoprotein with Yx(FWY)xxD motif